MTTNRRIAIYIILIAGTLSIASLAVLSWMSPLTIDSLGHHQVALYITNVQFDDDYLNITVTNVGVKTTTITSVMINQSSTIHTVPVYEPILGRDKIITIRIGFKWTSGYTVQIKLETADNLDYNYCNTYSAVAL